MSNLQTLASSSFGYQNFFSAQLTADLSDSATDVFLDDVPTPDEGCLVIDWDVPAKREVIFYTSKTATKVTCHASGRGFDSTTAVEHTTGANVIMAPIAEWFRYIEYLATNSPLGWSSLGETPNTVTYNGQNSYDLVFNSTDLTDTLSKRMRLEFTRGTAAPDQCADLESGSTQYFNRASGSLTGITFTDDFTVMAWIKVESYDNIGAIVSRFNGTSGWQLRLISGGIGIYGFNGGGGNYRGQVSNEAIAPGKWVHVAASLNMSANTGAIYINGKSVPITTSNGGTSPTSLAQAGNLEIGARNGGSDPFDGKIAQVGLFNAVLSEATIQQYATRPLTGSETNNIGAWSLDGVLTDLNANGNTLTAQGSATATNDDSPFGNRGVSTTLDYGVITGISFSTNTTVTVQVPEGCTIDATNAISTVRYSTQDTPYKFPGERGRWSIEKYITSEQSLNTTINSWGELLNNNFYVPPGAWKVGFEGDLGQSNSSASLYAPYIALSTSNSAPSDVRLVNKPVGRESGTAQARFPVFRSASQEHSSMTTYYVLLTHGGGGGTVTVSLYALSTTTLMEAFVLRADFEYV